MDQFPSAEHLSSWAGMSPGNHESGGKKNSKNGAREQGVKDNACGMRLGGIAQEELLFEF